MKETISMQLDRRQFLAATAVIPAAAAWQAATSARTVKPLLDPGFARVTRVSEGVYVTIADPKKGPQCLSNGGVIVGRDAALVIEGHFQPAGAALELSAARLLRKAPIRAAVETHYHFDHTFGNSGYARERVPIMAHEQVPALMLDRYARLKGTDKAALLRPLEQQIARASNEISKQHLETDLAAAKWIYGAIDATEFAYPTELLTAADCPKRIDLGGLVAVIDHHPGHTPTDLMVSIPQRDIAFVGDLLFYESYPVAIDADMMAWRGVLDMLAREYRGARLVPGHGPICGLDRVRSHADLMDDLRQHATRMMETGASVEEASDRYEVPARFQPVRYVGLGLDRGSLDAKLLRRVEAAEIEWPDVASARRRRLIRAVAR